MALRRMIMELQSSMKTTGSTNPATNLRLLCSNLYSTRIHSSRLIALYQTASVTNAYNSATKSPVQGLRSHTKHTPLEQAPARGNVTCAASYGKLLFKTAE